MNLILLHLMRWINFKVINTLCAISNPVRPVIRSMGCRVCSSPDMLEHLYNQE